MYKIIAKLVLIFLVIFSFVTNAAIVSDNDGSAFVTNDFSDYLIQEIL